MRYGHDSLAVVAGALVGLALVLWFVTRKKTYLPALPPISFFALLFLALAKLLMG